MVVRTVGLECVAAAVNSSRASPATNQSTWPRRHALPASTLSTTHPEHAYLPTRFHLRRRAIRYRLRMQNACYTNDRNDVKTVHKCHNIVINSWFASAQL